MIELSMKTGNDLIGPSSKIWLGVPLKIHNNTFGVIAVQSYTNPRKFSLNDADILQLVADHIALVIERKKAEEALIKSEKRYRNLVENIEEVIFSVHPTGKFSYISPSVKDLTGYSQDEILAVNDPDAATLQAGIGNRISIFLRTYCSSRAVFTGMTAKGFAVPFKKP